MQENVILHNGRRDPVNGLQGALHGQVRPGRLHQGGVARARVARTRQTTAGQMDKQTDGSVV